MENSMAYESDLNLKATELRLGLPGSDDSEKQQPATPSTCRTNNNNKRAAPEPSDSSTVSDGDRESAPPPAKSQVVGWPPVRSYRKNTLQQANKKETDVAGRLVKVVVDGAPYLRKIDLKVYGSYSQLIKALEEMFKLNNIGYSGSDYCPTYEDKDGDWMLVGDVPWEMFMCSCKRLRIMKGSEDRC